MVDERNAGFLRRSPLYVLTEYEINHLKNEINIIGANASVFRFNSGPHTSYKDNEHVIYVRTDVFPDNESLHPRSRMSERAVLAHEYYGHYLLAPSRFEAGDWRDELRASYVAAIKTPNLSNEDRSYLIQDAYERAKEQGINIRYNRKAVEIVYGIYKN